MRKFLSWFLATLLLIAPASANQSNLWSPTTGTVTGLQLTNNYNGGFSAIASCNSGTTSPANEVSGLPIKGQCWLDTSVTPNVLRIYDGSTTWLPIGYLDATNHFWTPITGSGNVNTIASAGTTDLCSTQPSYVEISGTTTITSFSNTCQTGQTKWIRFQGALTLTHNATSLFLPNSGNNITTAANDTAQAVYLGSGNWRVISYIKASGFSTATASNTITHTTKTANYTAVSGDNGSWIDGTSGTWTLTLTAPATLGNGWWIYFSNNGTGNITISPASGTIDGLSSFVAYPGEARLIQGDGSNFQTILLAPFNFVITATGSTTFTVPPKYSSIGVYICGAGGGGSGGARQSGNNAAGGGGGGGGYCWDQTFQPGALGSSQSVTIGTGGSAGAGATVNNTGGSGGNAGGNSTFGSLLTAKGGAGGNGTNNVSQGGGGGGGGGPNFNAGNGANNTSVGTDSEFMAAVLEQGSVAGTQQGGCAGATGTNTAFSGNMISCGQGGGGGGGGGGGNNGGAQQLGTPGSNSTLFGGPGGGGGGGTASGGAVSTGGTGGKAPGCQTAPAGGTSAGGAGGSTASSATYLPGCGGGGGGSANGATVGGAGGAGTSAGGGGGGGGANGANGGSGGAGGNGLAWIKGNI